MNKNELNSEFGRALEEHAMSKRQYNEAFGPDATRENGGIEIILQIDKDVGRSVFVMPENLELLARHLMKVARGRHDTGSLILTTVMLRINRWGWIETAFPPDFESGRCYGGTRPIADQ